MRQASRGAAPRSPRARSSDAAGRPSAAGEAVDDLEQVGVEGGLQVARGLAEADDDEVEGGNAGDALTLEAPSAEDAHLLGHGFLPRPPVRAVDGVVVLRARAATVVDPPF